MKIAHLMMASTLLLPIAALAGPDVSGPGRVRMVLDASARCLVDDRPDSVQRFLSLAPESKDAVRHAKYLNASECIVSASRGQDLVFSVALLRGAFYRELYVRAFEKAAPGLRSTASAVAADPALAQVAECLVRKAPNTARTLVLAPAESELEAKAFAALYARIGTCPPAPPPFSKTMLSGVIAETLFKLSDGAASAGASS